MRNSKRRFAIVVERAKNNFAAYVPDLPGCVATGATVKATERLLREAIEIHVAGLREDGLPVPEPSTLAMGILGAAILCRRNSYPLSHHRHFKDQCAF